MFDKNNWCIAEKELTEDQYLEVCKYLVDNYENYENGDDGYTKIHDIAQGDSPNNWCSWDVIGVVSGKYDVYDLPNSDLDNCTKITYQDFVEHLLNTSEGEVNMESQNSIKSDWIKWYGGYCPVDAGTVVDVKYRDGIINEHIIACVPFDKGGSCPERNASWWSHLGSSLDIVEYRLHKPSEDVSKSTNTKPQDKHENTSQGIVDAFIDIQELCIEKGVAFSIDILGNIKIHTSYGSYSLDIDHKDIYDVIDRMVYVDKIVKGEG